MDFVRGWSGSDESENSPRGHRHSHQSAVYFYSIWNAVFVVTEKIGEFGMALQNDFTVGTDVSVKLLDV